jgi:microsomal dipeptidase-like Zn-dependent dipeptidase
MQKCDLHCDLLYYLALNPTRTFNDPIVRCSIPQLKKGNVSHQVLAIYSSTEKGSTKIGRKQIELFQQLSSDIHFYYAFENSSSFCSEEDSLIEGITYLDKVIQQIGNPAYISLTWNMENRFGGGAHTKIGLKEDGKRLMDHLNSKNIPLDLSHTSDALAYEMLNYIDAKGYQIPILASHSNFRAVKDVSRNLPDALALEVKKRKGVIGFNFVKPFLGDDPQKAFVDHLEHALKLGLQDVMCFGADFFCEEDLPIEQRKKMGDYYYKEYGDASVYDKVLDLWKKHLDVDDDVLQKMCSGNFLNTFHRKSR